MPGDDAERRREVGRRMATWRRRRGLTRKTFGELCGRSLSWVEKVEAGERGLLRLPMLERVAEVLNVPVETLIGNSGAEQTENRCLDAFEVGEIRNALQRYQAVSVVLRPQGSAEPPQLAQLQQQTTYAWISFQNARYPALGKVLPALLRGTQDAVAHWSDLDDDGIHARTLLSHAYQVAASTLWKLKEIDLAWLAAERGLTVAEQTGDSLLISDAARRVAQGLMMLGQHSQSLELLNADIDRLEPGLGTASAEYLSLYGMLFLLGSVVAACNGKPAVAQELLSEGGTTAARLGQDRNDRYTAFGPTNVLLHRVAALIEAGDHGSAAEVASRVSPDGLAMLPRERRANFLIDTARCFLRVGRSDQAVTALLEADHLAADEVRCRPVALDLMRELSRTSGARSSWPLQQLVSRVGLVVS
jgi:transcriptional regulator with XRE-family HTH domain